MLKNNIRSSSKNNFKKKNILSKGDYHGTKHHG